MSRAVGLFAKPALEGLVKTRLVPPLTAAEAARLYAAFLADAAEMLGAADATGTANATRATARTGAAAPLWEWRVFSTDPDLQRATWPDAPRPSAWHLQEGDDLGERMRAALEVLLAAGHEAALIVGSDHPTLPSVLLERAFAALSRADVVLDPSLDGGYYLVGVRAPRPEIFRDIPWSTPVVLERTLERAAAHGLRPALLEPWYDVDRPEDLEVLRRHLGALARAGETAGRHTHAVLAAVSGAQAG